MHEALIVSWTSHGNLGDQAYTLAFPRLLPGWDVAFRDHATPDDDHDTIVLGGGDVVHDVFTRSFTTSQAARAVAASVSVTNDSDFGFLRACRRVIVRDEASRGRCLERGVACEVLPDFAFVLEPDAGRGREWIRRRFADEGRDLYDKVVCCVPNGYTFFGDHASPSRDHVKALSVADDLAWAFDRLDASVLLLPFGARSPADDRVPASYVDSRCKWFQKNVVVHDRLDVQTTLDVVAACDALVGNRLHALIFASLGGVRFVALDHHAKIGDFVREVGQSSWLRSFHGFDRESALSSIEGHLADGHDASLRDWADRARSDIFAGTSPCV